MVWTSIVPHIKRGSDMRPMVELRGVEPLSESALTRLSPGAVRFQHSLSAQTPDRLRGSVES